MELNCSRNERITSHELAENRRREHDLSYSDVFLKINNDNETSNCDVSDEKTAAINGDESNFIQPMNRTDIELNGKSVSSCEEALLNGNQGARNGDLAQDGTGTRGSSEDRLPDGGWGWVVVFGAALILILVDIVGQCFGILFSSFLLDLETPSAVTAWIFNLFSFIWCMTGPPLGPLIAEYGWRNLTFIGSVLLATATIASAFVKAAWPLFFTYSLLAGIGCGIISNISYMIVPNYFKNRRGFANGIIMAFDCGGQLIGSPLIHLLQDEYTYTGATLIIGGVILNCCIGAAVFHPVEWHLKPRIPKVPGDAETQLLTPVKSRLDETRFSESHLEVFKRLIKSTVADLVILKSTRASMIAASTALIFSGYLNFLAVIPFAMQESGYSLKEAALCVSVSAICNMVTRVVVASLSDSKWFDFRRSMMVGSLTISSTMVCFTLLEDLTLMKVTMGLWGCGVGIFMSLFNLVMVHYMGLHNLTRMIGASMLCIAVGYLVIGPLAGYVRDVTNSYTLCIWFLAFSVFSSFLLWFFLPVNAADDHERHEKRQDGEDEKDA